MCVYIYVLYIYVYICIYIYMYIYVVNIVKCCKYCQKGPAAAVLFKKVKIVWFDHTGHAQLLQSCNRECSDIFYLSMVWIDYTEGNAQIKQSCENCFPNHWQRPSQS